jgi:chromosome segregation ATPase
LQDKQDLIVQATQAMDLLDKEKTSELDRSHLIIDELNQKIESLEHEVSSLQNALAAANKSTSANDTGYADFLGAVDTKEIECRRRMMELQDLANNFRQDMNIMNEKVKELQNEKKIIEIQASSLLYENDEMKDKISQVEKQMVDQVSIELSLNTYIPNSNFPR